MFIKKLELQGFKSFPERTKILIHPGITAIIGPNGTGKSNIVDSILFVFGGKRSKSVRSERTEDFIFNGNNSRPPMNMADVSLFLGKEEQELIINHRVYRTGESEYRLNGKIVRLRDIHDELWKHNIGDKDYFIIEQGTIGLFLSAKPKEKRQLIEEAAGTTFYKEKRRQAENKLENSEQNLLRLEDILSEVEKRINSLRRQAQASRRYRKLRESIREKTLSLFRKKIELMEKEQNAVIFSYQDSLQKEKEMKTRLNEEESKLSSLMGEILILEQKIKEEQTKLRELQSKLSHQEMEKDNNFRRLNLLNEKRESIKSEKKEIRSEIESLEKRNSSLKKEQVELESFLKNTANELQTISNILSESEKEVRNSQEELEEKRKEHLKLLSILTEIKNKKVSLEKEMEILLKQDKRMEERLQNIQSSSKEINKRKEAAERKKTDISGLKEKLNKSLNETEKLIREKKKEIEDCAAQEKKISDEISTIKHHLQAIRKVLDQAKSGEPQNIPGNLCLLADLIETDAQTARLVDTFWEEEAGARLISIQDIGEKELSLPEKGTYLLFKPETKLETHPRPKEKDIKGFLKSCLKVKMPAESCLNSLPDAALVENKEKAVELWQKYPDLNFITLNGDILLSSGLLKLGRKKEGLVSFKQEIKSLEKRLNELEQNLKPLNQKHIDAENILAELEAQKKQAENELSQKEKEFTSLENEISYLEKEISRLAEEKNILLKEKKLLLSEKTSLDSKLKKIEQEELRLEDNKNKKAEEMEKLSFRISELQKSLEAERTKSFEIRTNFNLLQEKKKNLKAQLSEIRKREENLSEKKLSLEEEESKTTEEETMLKKKLEQTGKEITRISSEEKEKASQLLQLENELNRLQTEKKQSESNVSQIKEKYESIKEERISREIKKAEKERDRVNLEESCWQETKQSLEEIKKTVPIDKIEIKMLEEILSEEKDKLQKFGGVNLMAEDEYQQEKKRYDFLQEQKKDLRDSIDSTKEAIQRIDKESKLQFLKALNEVNKNFQEIFSLLFNGGQAEVILTEPDSPLESGVEIAAQPPGKKVQKLDLLSGGEKSLTSLAFLFALFRYRPAPFCILDEVDAALDEANIGRFLNLMKNIKNRTQFIIITHNFKTMGVADYIYGTTMSEPNVTSIYSMKLDKKMKERADK